MNANTSVKQQQTHLSSPAEGNTYPEQEPLRFAEIWPVIRAILVVWAAGVWLLLVMMPGMDQVNDIATAMIHLPHVFISLGLLGAIFMAYNLKSDGHLLWFLGVLLLIAGWM